MDILIWSEKASLARELASQARTVADKVGGSVVAVQYGLAEAINWNECGVDVAYTIEAASDPETCAAVLSGAVQQTNANLVLIGATKLGMEVAPRVAERMSAGYAAWTLGFEIDGSNCVTARCMLYTGTGLAMYQFKPGPVVLTAASGVFEAKDTTGRQARVETLNVSIGAARITVVGDQPKAKGARLEEAKLVVDVGQGVKQREDLEMIRALANVLDGQLACSRPVASDRDWFPEWLGLSGAKIKPELCLTVGVSGAIQHIVGIRDSRVIAAVNNDENAAIFTQADYGVVADLYEFLPALMERLKARGIRPAWNG
jgi:electron transfer flavoprotein alpha subunit